MVKGTMVEISGLLKDHTKPLENFISRSHYITLTMLSCLSDALKLENNARFEMSHRDGEPSDSALKLYYELTQANPADIPDNTHTDRGTLTLLFGEQWGLEAEIPETKTWGFVQPKAGYAVVNVADSLQNLSGKRLHSCVHRVTQPVPGVQRRHFVVYLLRPEIDAVKF
jgi:isopenicillin N synthase-like dioxygenase